MTDKNLMQFNAGRMYEYYTREKNTKSRIKLEDVTCVKELCFKPVTDNTEAAIECQCKDGTWFKLTWDNRWWIVMRCTPTGEYEVAAEASGLDIAWDDFVNRVIAHGHDYEYRGSKS